MHQKKKLTTLRLELMSILIRAKCFRFIAEQMNLDDTRKILLTDSQCVLKYTKQKENTGIFVFKNRVQK